MKTRTEEEMTMVGRRALSARGLQLHRAFSTILTAAAGTMLVASGAACGGATSASSGGGDYGDGGGTSEYQSLCTGPVASLSLLKGMRADPPLDGAVTRMESAFLPASGHAGGDVKPPPPGAEGDGWTAMNLDSAGSICATATDKASCQSKTGNYRVLPTNQAACDSQYPASSYGNAGCSIQYILYSRGNEIGVARTDAETKALLGRFDTVTEALWAAGGAGWGLSCSSPNVADSQYRITPNGEYDLQLIKGDNCAPNIVTATVHVDYAGTVTVVDTATLPTQGPCAVAGRRPEGLSMPRAPAAGGTIGQYFAQMAILEGAAVVAFRRLYRELTIAKAPAELLARVRTAIKDEIRHTRKTTSLARKYGVTPQAPRITPCVETRSLFDMAVENVREGCVRETYSALVAHHQATHAEDREVRACMAEIAFEETEHAAISWDVADFLETRLTSDERARLAHVRRAAFEELSRELAVGRDQVVERATGAPPPHVALELLAGLSSTLAA